MGYTAAHHPPRSADRRAGVLCRTSGRRRALTAGNRWGVSERCGRFRRLLTSPRTILRTVAATADHVDWRARFPRLLVVITAGGAVLRLGYLWLFDYTTVSGDSNYFHYGALFLVDGLGFVDPVALIFTGIEAPGAGHPPGWTVALALPSFLGFRSIVEHQVFACLLGTATVAMVGLAGRRLAGSRAGLIAAAIAAVYPYFWMYEAAVLSETLALLLAALLTLLALRFWDSPSTRAAVAVGVVLGLLTLTRAEQVLLLGFLIVPLTIVLPDAPRRQRLGWCVAAIGTAGLVMLPWIALNLSRFQEPNLITTNGGAAMAIGACDQAFRGPDMGSRVYECGAVPWMDDAGRPVTPINVASYLSARGEDASTLDAERRDQAIAYTRDHLTDAPAVVFARVGRTWGVFRPFHQFRHDFVDGDKVVLQAAFLSFWIVAALAIRGVVVLRRRRVSLWIPGAFAATVTLATALTFGQPRYRATADVAVVMLAAVALDSVLRRRDALNAWRDGRKVTADLEAAPGLGERLSLATVRRWLLGRDRSADRFGNPSGRVVRFDP
jgi:hypothetical protein